MRLVRGFDLPYTASTSRGDLTITISMDEVGQGDKMTR
jgi:hypothetical protein